MDTAERVKKEEQMVVYNGVDRLYAGTEAEEYFSKFKYPPAIKSEMTKIDNCLDGFEQEEIIIISGKSGSGKTTMAITLTYNFCLQEKNVLWLPFEKGGRHFLNKFTDGVPKNNFYLPINIQAYDVNWIEQKIIECRCKNGLDVVFIDHLHYIVPPNPGQNMATQIGQVMRALVRLAQEYKFTLFLLAHVGSIKEDRRARKDDIKDSSAIVQESDTVIIVERITEDDDAYYEKNNPNRSFIYIDKNRRTGTLAKIDVEKTGARYYERNVENSIYSS